MESVTIDPEIAKIGRCAAGQTQAPIEARRAASDAGVMVGEALAAAAQDDTRPAVFRRCTGEDVNHALKGTGTIARLVGAAHDLDAFHVFQTQRQILPVHCAGCGIDHRATVHHHL